MARDPLAQDVTERCEAKPPRPTKGYACQFPANCNVPSGCHITIWEALTLPGPPPSGPGWESSPDHQLHRAGNGGGFTEKLPGRARKHSALSGGDRVGRGRTKRAPSSLEALPGLLCQLLPIHILQQQGRQPQKDESQRGNLCLGLSKCLASMKPMGLRNSSS